MHECMNCHEVAETKHLPLYVIGSEGLDLCHKCEMELVGMVRDWIHATARLRLHQAKQRKIDQSNVRLAQYALETGDTVYTLSDFQHNCEEGVFIDYDGFGYYASLQADGKTILVSRNVVEPSDIQHGKLDTSYTHVVWYNR